MANTRDLYEYELALLTKIANGGSFRQLIELGIDGPGVFGSEAARAAFIKMKRVYNDVHGQGSTMSLDHLVREVPVFEPVVLDIPVAQLAVHVLNGRLRRVGSDLAEAIQEAVLSDNPDILGVVKKWMPALSKAGRKVRPDCDLSLTSYDNLSEYLDLANSTAVPGIPYPWPLVTEATLGMQPEQLIVFYARPKSMKTFVVVVLGCNAYHRHNCRVLFITKEMTDVEIRKRSVACISRIPYQDYRHGRLSEADFDRYVEAVQELHSFDASPHVLRNGRAPYFKITTASEEQGLLGVQAKIDAYEPDLVIVDGAYLLVDRKLKTWDSTRLLTQDSKKLAQDYKVPIVITTQANREGEKTQGENMTEIAYGDSFAQDSDLVGRIIKTDYQPVHTPEGEFLRRRTELAMVFPGFREGKLNRMAIAMEPFTDLSEIGRISKKELQRRVQLAEEQEEQEMLERMGADGDAFFPAPKCTNNLDVKRVIATTNRTLKNYKPEVD